MSSLDQDEADKQLQKAVPWVSDPHDPKQRDEQTRRLQEEVIEAARRLESELVELPSQPSAGPRSVVDFHLPAPRVRKEAPSSEDRARKIWAELKPQFVAPQERAGVSGLVMVAGLTGAMAISAIVATIVVNVFPHPAIIADLAGEERAAKGDSRAAATLGDLTRFSEAQAKMTRTDEPIVPPETLLASAPPNEIAAPPATISPPPVRVEPARPEVATPAANPAPVANAVPEPPSASPLPQDEVASLLKRGQDLLAVGDIASARLLLTLVAESGNPEACFILAGTFDPAVLAHLRAIGVRGDPAKARAWYARAAELGSLQARQRLQALR